MHGSAGPQEVPGPDASGAQPGGSVQAAVQAVLSVQDDGSLAVQLLVQSSARQAQPRSVTASTGDRTDGFQLAPADVSQPGAGAAEPADRKEARQGLPGMAQPAVPEPPLEHSADTRHHVQAQPPAAVRQQERSVAAPTPPSADAAVQPAVSASLAAVEASAAGTAAAAGTSKEPSRPEALASAVLGAFRSFRGRQASDAVMSGPVTPAALPALQPSTKASSADAETAASENSSSGSQPVQVG